MCINKKTLIACYEDHICLLKNPEISVLLNEGRISKINGTS